jgi:hypothetical protein
MKIMNPQKNWEPIVRDDTTLKRLTWNRSAEEFTPLTPDSEWTDLPAPGNTDVQPFGTPRNDRERCLQAAWNMLSEVSILNADILTALLTVLIESLPAALERTSNALPSQLDQPREIAPTAAHPRAYKGTKSKPPKPKSPATRDLRSYLNDPASTTRILQELEPFWDEACRSLVVRFINKFTFSDLLSYGFC